MEFGGVTITHRISNGGITASGKQFEYNNYLHEGRYFGEIIDGNKIHVFEIPVSSLGDGYRKPAIEELKKIGWIEKTAF